MKRKRVTGHVSLPPALIRLAAVLAEIAGNEATYTPTTEPVCTTDDPVEQKSKNPLVSRENESC